MAENKPTEMLPKVAARTPVVVELVAGEKKAWCRCGLSKNQPWCDGSHKGTGISPLVFTPEASEKKALCRCKYTKNAPYCDGTHRKLAPETSNKVVKDIEDLGGPSKASSQPQIQSPSEEPYLAYVKSLARGDISSHGPMVSMGVPLTTLPRWEDIQILVAQLHTKPLMESVPVDTSVVIGRGSKKPLKLEIPIFVSDMSYGALSRNAKVALSKGAELAGTGICSGEGGMLQAENDANSRYFYEYASAKFGYSIDKVKQCAAFHFKGGQGAKTGTGGHLPGNKVTPDIAEVRGLEVGQDAISPPTFDDLHTPEDFKAFSDNIRAETGGIPIGFKISAQHIEADVTFAVEAGADYIILDGRGGATGAAPQIFRDNISIPTIPALARARYCLDRLGAKDVSLIITGGLRTPSDFIKALALGADAVAVANAALHSIGCVAARICGSNECPSGVATQNPELSSLIDVDKSAQQLFSFVLNFDIMPFIHASFSYATT